MEFAELSTFVRIVELGSLSGAARATGQSLPTVSRQLRSLELELDSELALRTTRRLTVTEAGQRLYEHARRALNELERAKSVAGTRASEKLVLSVPVTLGQCLVVPQLAKLLTSRPGLRLEVRLEDRLTELLAENVDVVVRAGLTPPDSPDLIAQPLFSFHRYLVAAPSYLKVHGAPKTVEGLANHECLLQLSVTSGPDRYRLQTADEERVVNVSGRLAASAPQTLHEGARAGLGIALLPSWLVREDVEARRLKRVLSDWQSAEITAYAVYRRSLRGSAGVKAFVAALAAVNPSPAPGPIGQKPHARGGSYSVRGGSRAKPGR